MKNKIYFLQKIYCLLLLLQFKLLYSNSMKIWERCHCDIPYTRWNNFIFCIDSSRHHHPQEKEYRDEKENYDTNYSSVNRLHLVLFAC